MFTFHRLSREKKKDLDDLSIQEITQYVAEQDVHKLEDLADSIKRNGVQVPLIVRDDGKLLDGNRRYFACEWLKMRAESHDEDPPSHLSEIPVDVIREADLTPELELKILAEANFIQDLKIPWPLDAQARAVAEFYSQRLEEFEMDEAIEEAVEIFGIKRQRVVDLLETLELTKEFINEARTESQQIERRAIVEDKFVYFWEFRNKATKGRGAFNDKKELREVKRVFFDYMAKGPDSPIKNVKQVEPLVQSRRVPMAWEILNESKGTKLPLVVSIVTDKKEERRAEDRIRVFLAWLKEAGELSERAKTYLQQLATLVKEKTDE